MIIFGLGIIVVILLIIFFGVLFFMGTVVFGANKLGYKKTAKFLAISFLSIILLGAFLLIYDLFKVNQKTKEEINQILSYTRIKLKDDYEIVKQKDEWDLIYNRTNFILKISNEDYQLLKKKYPNNILRDSVSHNEPFDYDTLRVKIDKNKNLYFYRAHHNYDN
jgi:energy-coupling factor transporter transmembrane protein EcfT